MRPAFPTSDYYEGSAPPQRQQPTASLPAPSGQPRDGSHVHRRPIDGGGAQLFPCSLATSTPQTFLMASAPATKFRRRSRPPGSGQACTAPRPTSARLEPMPRLRGFSHWFALATPSRLACRTQAVWQCRPVPSLSGLLPSTPCASRAGLPPASATRCDGPPLDISFHSVNRRLVAHSVLAAQPGQVAGAATETLELEAHHPNRPAQPRSPRKPLSRPSDPKTGPGQ